MKFSNAPRCLCFIECINLVEEKRINARLAKYFIFFLSKLNKFNNTGARTLDSFYHMTF